MEEYIVRFDYVTSYFEEMGEIIQKAGYIVRDVDSLTEWERCFLTDSLCMAGVLCMAQIKGEYGRESFMAKLSSFCHKNAKPVYLCEEEACREDEVQSLQCGVTDYLYAKQGKEVIAQRILSKLPEKTGISLFEEKQAVAVEGKYIMLSEKEYALFVCLFEKLGSYASREWLIEMVWGKQYAGSLRVVDTTIKQLRKRFADTGINFACRYKKGYYLYRDGKDNSLVVQNTI